MIGLTKLAPGPGNVALSERTEPSAAPGHVVLDVTAAGHLRHRPAHLRRRVRLPSAGDDGARGLGRRRRARRRRRRGLARSTRRDRDVLLDVRALRPLPERPDQPVPGAPLDRLVRRRRLRPAPPRAGPEPAPHSRLARRTRRSDDRAACLLLPVASEPRTGRAGRCCPRRRARADRPARGAGGACGGRRRPGARHAA